MENLVEPISLYQDLTLAGAGTDEYAVNMFNGKFTGNIVPKGYEIHCEKLLVYSQDLEEGAVHLRGQPKAVFKTGIGYGLSDVKDEYTLKILINGAVTAYADTAGYNRQRIDEGYMLPYYELRLITKYARNTIDFPYKIDEGGNVYLVIQRPTVPTALSYDVVITARLIGKMLQKTLL